MTHGKQQQREKGLVRFAIHDDCVEVFGHERLYRIRFILHRFYAPPFIDGQFRDDCPADLIIHDR
jgi:hypothetical protein